jgi:hypothetical protein
MEREQVAQLLEKYWQVETTVEEERLLAEYFRGADLPLEWAPYREIFCFYEQERDVKPGEGLEQRIMERAQPRLRLHGAWWAAAAVIVLLLGLEPLLRVQGPGDGTAQVKGLGAEETEIRVAAEQGGLAVKDTYDDPQQALAAVRKALLVASRNMNKGLHALN